MLDQETKRRIDTARDILVGKLPNPQSQVEQITIAMIYKFMDDMDKEAMEFGGEATFFTGDYEKYSWTKIFDPKLGGYEMLALYGEAIVKLNQNPNIPQLFRDIFKNAYLPYRDPETLKMFLKVINEFHYDHSEKLGDAFEYLLSVLGSQGDAGQFRTPRHIIDFMVAIMQPKKDESICDPACGTAGFLISSYRHILNENTKKDKGDLLTPDERKKLINNFVGYDISSEMVRLSLVNMYLHGFTTPKIYEYDTLTSTDRWGDTFDIIMANPPFMTPKGGIRPHKKFAMQANRSEVLFVDYIMEHINPTTGRAAVIVPEGIIFQSATAYKALRKLLVENNFLYGVVSLPAGIFQPYSGVKTSILLLDKTLAKKTDKILFVKIENDGYSLGAQRKELATSDLPDATNFIKQYITAIRNNDFSLIDFEHLPLNSIAVEKSRIAENGDYNLSGDRYKDSIAKKHSKFDLVELSEVCDLYQPQTISASDFKENGEYKVFGANGVIGYYDKYNHEESEVLITCRGATCGTINFSEPKSWITGNAMVAKPIDNRINKRFLFHLLKASDLSSVITGAAQPQITRASLSPFKIPLPTITVQLEIEAKIEQYEKIIAGAKQVVENYKPQIDIKPEWEMVELGSITNITSSKRIFQEEYTDEGIPFYRTKEIVELSQGKEISLELYISKERFKELKTKNDIPKKGELLISAVGTLGIIWVISDDREFYFKDGNLIWVKDLKGVNPFFLKYILENAFSYRMAELSNGAAYNAITIVKLKQLGIPIPPLSEQEAIVSQIEKEQQLVNASKELIKIYEQKIKDEINKLWEE
ncbi:N-6 DNA methylase [Seramator thermalis]|uniref:N-6 DNA methylase n=1 Tax=Seramator thermalis TaxID=2496270 RepID=UPI00101B84C4|nr:N-6 DNA methylase [Seramator thermalis]